MWKKVVLWLVIAGAAIGLVAQLVPYGREHPNPPVVSEPVWQDRTLELAKGACFDCHSNETNWPWYSNIAPTSWLLAGDVSEGREALNFSEWQSNDQAIAAAESMEDGSMPPFQYGLMHSDARLSAEESAELIAGFRGMAGQ
jgi:hypothetical protein